MLIFTHLRASIAELKGTAKYLFSIFIVATFAACSDKVGNEQLVTEKPANQNISKQANDQVANSLLEGGFYQEQTPPASDQTKTTEENAVEPTPYDDPETASSLDTKQSDEAQMQEVIVQEAINAAQTEDTTSNNKSLVEDLGFSEAQLSQDTLVNTEAPKLFCLNNDSTAENRQSIEDACQKISKRLASVKFSACQAAKLQTTGCASVKGFPILMSEFSPLKERKPQGRILIVGGTHGDELTSVSMIIRWIEKLNRHHSGLFHWHMVPMMNPDGVLKSGATRTNDNGVDLNRNMPSDDWERNAIKYWVEKGGKDPRKYPGESASSEPETQWLLDEIENFKPDAIISVHAPYGVVDFDSLLLNTAPKSLGKLHLNLLGTYPGSLGNYAGINLNIPVITLELPHSWVMPSEAESTKIWEDIVSWLKKNVNTEVAKN